MTTATRQQGKETLLLVDENSRQIQELAHRLDASGIQVERANNYTAALSRLAASEFDVLLAEATLPGMDADAFQKAARERLPDLAVLLMTQEPEVHAAVQFLKEGVMDYIVRPFEGADVVARIEVALKRKGLVLEEREQKASIEKRLQLLLPKSIQALSLALKAKDEFTYKHSESVALLTVALAEELCPGNTLLHHKLRLAARFHDIGKMGVPEGILHKTGNLTLADFDRIKKHPEIGETILRPLLSDPEILSTVRHHHERWDGSGYPDGLKGEAIPLGARIVSVAVSYDAMTSISSYRARMANDRALRILREGSGSQWDPTVISALLAMADSGRLADFTENERSSDASRRAHYERAA